MSNILNNDNIIAGDAAFMLGATALVLSMTIPGLAMYYGGMVRIQNVLTTAMQIFSITCVITILWIILGYSLSLAPVTQTTGISYIGDSSRIWLENMNLQSTHFLAPHVPEVIYCFYQLTFAIITAALICGSFSDRMRYGPMLLFISLWHILVYCPIAHANWHQSGFLYRIGTLDFAGGNVVHIASGVSGLASALVVGKRQGFGVDRFNPYNILITLMGASLLWVGWLGFNGGSAMTADSRAGFAILATQVSASCSAITWMLTEWYFRKR
eukprot:gene14304-30436_t